MKKKVLFLCLLAVFVLFSITPVFAEQRDIHIMDPDGVLDAGEFNSLEDLAAEVSDRYECGVYIALFQDMRDYGYDDIELFAEDVYHTWDLGYGDQNDGIILVMTMAERHYDLAAYGSFANLAFTDYGKEVLADVFLDDFRRDDWYSGFVDYIRECDSILSQAQAGTPLDIGSGYSDNFYYYDDAIKTEEMYGVRGFFYRIKDGLNLGIPVGLFIAFLRCAILKKKMKSAVLATEASEYVAENGVSFLAREDRFAYSTVVRKRIEHNRGSSGGTSVGGSGFSHSNGDF